MLVSNVFCSIIICIATVAARAAKEERLRAAIIAGLMSTTTTHLARVPGVHSDHLDPALLPFVIDEAIQLGKGPTMQFSFVLHVLVLFAAPDLGGVTDVGEISSTMVAPEGVCWTRRLARTWSQSRWKRACRLLSFFKWRMADFDPLDWSLRRRRKARRSTSFQ